MCRLHINCTPVVEERDRIVIYVGNFHGSSEFGIIQLCRRLQQNTSGKSSSALYDFSLMTSSEQEQMISYWNGSKIFELIWECFGYYFFQLSRDFFLCDIVWSGGGQRQF